METILMTAACLALVAGYVAWCRRKDRLADREHQAVIMAMSPGPRILELTAVRPNPLRMRRFTFPSTSPMEGSVGTVTTSTDPSVDSSLV